MAKVESALHYKFPIISFYSAWGDKPTQTFPLRMVETITSMGSVPMITWEPWVVDFDERLERGDRQLLCRPFMEEAAHPLVELGARDDLVAAGDFGDVFNFSEFRVAAV